VLKAEPVLAAVARAHARHPRGARTIYLTPQGRRLDQALVRDLAASRDLVLLCGRYEGVDERAIELLRPEEVSIGDYVLSGGELAAMVVRDAVARLRPGVLGDELSPAQDSFGEGEGLLDHPHFTRPLDVRGLGVPDVLRSGDHGAIARWRHGQALERTRARRPDLLTPRTASTARPAPPSEGPPGPIAPASGRGDDLGGAGGRPPGRDGGPPPPPPDTSEPFVPDPD